MFECQYCKYNSNGKCLKYDPKDTVCKNFKASELIIKIVKEAMKEVEEDEREN